MLLETRTVEKPWGVDQLPPPFSNDGTARIGEIWFEPPAALPQLLVKYIFTSEALSVQVHPSDSQTQKAGLGKQGKEECWLVIDAEPGARLGIGLARPLDQQALRAAALDGSIEDLLAWHEVAKGDFFYIPAGTVHAIGAGVSIIEIQQNSDITYRLYDYGRPRELHLEQGVAVARPVPHDPALCRHLAANGSVELVSGPHFRLDRVDGQPDVGMVTRYPGKLLVIPLDGDVTVSGEVARPGGCALATSLAEVEFADSGQCLLAAPVTPA